MNQTLSPQPSPRPGRRWPAFLLGLGVFVALLLSLLGYRGLHGLESELARLRARGEELTFDELAIPYLTNGAPRTAALVKVINSIDAKPTGLGFVAPMSQVAPGRARILAQAPALPLDHDALAWSDLEAQLAAFAPQLAEIRQLVEDPEPDLGRDPKQFRGGPRRPFIEKRVMAQLLVLEVVRQAHAGRRSEALANLHALVQVARLHRRDPTLVSHMINVAIAGLGLHTTWEVLQMGGWTEAQLAALQQDWESLDLLGECELALLGERAAGLAYFEIVRHSGWQQLQPVGAGPGAPAPSALDLIHRAFVGPFYSALILPGDQRLFLEISQHPLDHVRLLRQDDPSPTLQTDLDAQWRRLTGPLESWHRIRYPTSSAVLPNTARALQITARHETLRQLAIAALAVERHRLRHGVPPNSLDDLVPALTPAIPRDPMGHRPLRYKPQPDGRWQLWSVGENGRDDGGDATHQPNQPAVSAPLWALGKDLVWPTPATADEVQAYEAEQARSRPRRSGGSSVPR